MIIKNKQYNKDVRRRAGAEIESYIHTMYKCKQCNYNSVAVYCS